MATIRWRGDAPAVAQVQSWTFGGTWETSDKIRVTIGGKTYDFTAGSTTTATVVSNMVTAWNALSGVTYPEFAELTASASTSTFKLTADTAGKPFTVSLLPLETDGSGADSQTIEGGTTATTGTATTASSGPNDWSTAANWSGGAVPVDSDDVYIEDSDGDILYGLDQASIQPTSLNIAMSYTGKIGLPAVNEDSSSGSYYEYRERYLKIGPATINLGRGEGTGFQRLNINCGTDQTTLNLFSSASPEAGRDYTVQWKGTHANNAVNALKGSLGIAIEAGETATVENLRVAYVDNQAGDVKLRAGAGVTLTNLVISGGVSVVGCATTTIVQNEGTLTLEGSGAHASLIVRGGICYYNSTGTLGGNPVVSNTGEISFAQDPRAKTVTNPIEVYGELAKVTDPFKVVSSLVLDMNEGGTLENLNIGRNVRITRGTPA